MKASTFSEGTAITRNNEIDKLKYIIGELHNILWKMWDVWKDIAIASYLVVVRSHKRKNIRLFVRIVGAEGKA
ncbi:MAG: hypothetical protein LBS22_02880 [Puniceicoccales bacterium]|jgi:hypothetical protein|nr:hypothetical protein [Puniceicoccales bacterium]